MALSKKQFTRGIILRADDIGVSGVSGEMKVSLTNQKLQVYLDGALRNVVTESQTQTLTNKTLVVASNTITTAASGNLAATELNAALAELQTSIDTSDTNLANHLSDATDAHDASAVSVAPAGNLASTDVQSALTELQTDIDTNATNLANHLADAVDAHDASSISNVPAGNLLATDVQTALNELQTDIDTNATNLSNHLADTVDAHDASAISSVASGNLAATDVQSALDELQTDIDTRATTAALTAHIDDITDAHDASAISSVASGNLVATDVQSALNELQTDIDTRATSAALTAHESDTSTHGTTGDIVGTTDTQTLTNKTLTSPTLNSPSVVTPSRLDVKQDTFANLTTYALTASNGQLCFATDTKTMYQVVDTALTAVGAGGATPDTFVNLDASEQLTNWTSGNNATFLGGGTVAGTFAKESTTPLNGDDSYKFTQAAGSLNDYIASAVQDVPVRFRGNIATLVFPYLYNGTSSDIEPIVYDVTNGAKLTTSTNLLPSTGTTASVYKANITIPATCTQVRIGFQVKALNSGKILQFDDLQLSSDVTIYANPSDNPQIVTASESFSTDTASLVYASSASYTLATLENAPVGTFITFTYASSTNTRTQTTTAPTQTTSDMNTNGFKLYARGLSSASTSGDPAVVAIQIGKNFKGMNLGLYKSTAKSTPGSLNFGASSTTTYGATYTYSEVTGILYIDAAYGNTNVRTFLFEDATEQTNGYVVVNASKSPALVGVPQVQPRIATIKDVKTSGTSGGASASAGYQDRTLNTLDDPTGIVTSLASNVFTLPAGSYFIEAKAPARAAAGHTAFVYNVTDAANAIIGGAHFQDAYTLADYATVEGIVTITSSKSFKIRHYTDNSNANGLGFPGSIAGVSEVYTQVKITKIK